MASRIICCEIKGPKNVGFGVIITDFVGGELDRSSTGCCGLLSAYWWFFKGGLLVYGQAPKMFIGAELPLLLVKPGSKTHAEQLMESSDAQKPFTDPFEGMPFRTFADFLGDRLFPSVEEMKLEERKQKKMPKTAQVYEAPPVPSLLPITHW